MKKIRHIMFLVAVLLFASSCDTVPGSDGGFNDGGVPADGSMDSGVLDGGDKDSGVKDGGQPDGQVLDGGAEDSGLQDGGMPDGSTGDAGSGDSGSGDTGTGDGGTGDGGTGQCMIGDVKKYKCPLGEEVPWCECVQLGCPVKCDKIGTKSEGWYDCKDQLIRWEQCSKCTPYCDKVGSKSEGWYNSCDDTLIYYDTCSIDWDCIADPEKQCK